MKASVIVPIFNNEKYIERCIISLLNQDYDNYEIIMVDDGSTDNSVSICEKYVNDKIRIITQPNQGAAAARNTGLINCSPDSEFVFFVDSDDTVQPNYLARMLREAADNKMVICHFNHLSSSKPLDEGHISEDSKTQSYENPFQSKGFLEELKNGTINSLCNKCFSLKIIRKNNLLIPKEYPEDTRFCLNYLSYCQVVTILSDKLYNYIKRPGSVTSRGYVELYDNYIEIQKRLYSVVPTEYHRYVGEFVYPQFLGNTKKFVRSGNIQIPKEYLHNKLIRRSISEYKPTCFGDAIVKYLFKFGMLNALARL